jgi:hypothetical protein
VIEITNVARVYKCPIGTGQVRTKASRIARVGAQTFPPCAVSHPGA